MDQVLLLYFDVLSHLSTITNDAWHCLAQWMKTIM